MAAKKPNILVLWGDDIGYWNISAYNLGMMGYKTPNIDRIAREGALFTDWYGQQSCTAGRACFITGQSGFRTGLLKVGLPGAKEGLQARDVTIAELLKAQGYMTAQFGKNHLGDADETSTCRRPTGSTSSWARSITSTPRRNRRTRTTSKIRK
jgi:arylsulfatase A-like enzyme